MHGICPQSAVALRSEPSHKSEVVSQLLYNDTYEVLEDSKDWLRVRCTHDAYEGWLNRLQHQPVSDQEFKRIGKLKKNYVSSLITSANGMMLSFGTTLFEATDDTIAAPKKFSPAKMVEYAKRLEGVPYMWGGRSVMGIDCSGFVQLCAKVAGLGLPRDASQQVECGEVVYFLQETRPGDIAFFSNESGAITHVGIIAGDERIIHASGQVRTDFLDQTGIFNKQSNTHTHFLQVIKRMS